MSPKYLVRVAGIIVTAALTACGGGGSGGDQSTAAVTPPSPGLIEFAAGTFSVQENAPSPTVSVVRRGGSEGSVSAVISFVAGTATAPADYSAATITVSFANGEAGPKNVPLVIVNDTLHEPDETFTAVLGNPTGGASIGSVSQSIGTIVDDDPAPAPAAPRAAVTGQPRTLHFDWTAGADATSYRVMLSPDGSAPFAIVGTAHAATERSADVPMSSLHLFDWVHALFRVEACNSAGCTPSANLSVSTVLPAVISGLRPSDSANGDNFGGSVSMSADGTLLAVGAPYQGDTNKGEALYSGAVYLFQLQAGSWQQIARVKPTTLDTFDNFGQAISLSADGAWLAVGAPSDDSGTTSATDNSLIGSGAVFVYQRSGSTWEPRGFLKASNKAAGDAFGSQVALSADGAALAISAPNQGSSSGAVYVFRRSGIAWSQESYLKASNAEASDEFGFDLALSSDGETLAIGAPYEDGGPAGELDNTASDSGAVYVFTHSGGAWPQQRYLKATALATAPAATPAAYARFGASVALSSDGNLLAVGSPRQDAESLPLADDGAGAVFVFTRSGTSWSIDSKVEAVSSIEGAELGDSVALSADGKVLIAGAAFQSTASVATNDTLFGSGAVYSFRRGTSGWNQVGYVKAPSPEYYGEFGQAIAIDSTGQILAAGVQSVAVPEPGAVVYAGAVYLY